MIIHVKEKQIYSFINPPRMCASLREISIRKWIPLPGDLTEELFLRYLQHIFHFTPPLSISQTSATCFFSSSNKTAGGTNDL